MTHSRGSDAKEVGERGIAEGHSRGGRLGLALAAGEVDEVELGLARDGDGVVARPQQTKLPAQPIRRFPR